MQSLFPRDVLDEIWDLIESVSESILTDFYQCLQGIPKKPTYLPLQNGKMCVLSKGLTERNVNRIKKPALVQHKNNRPSNISILKLLLLLSMY